MAGLIPMGYGATGKNVRRLQANASNKGDKAKTEIRMLRKPGSKSSSFELPDGFERTSSTSVCGRRNQSPDAIVAVAKRASFVRLNEA